MARTPAGYYLHLISWAQIGVLIRLYLAELFGSACPSIPWAPCLTSSGSRWGGAFFIDLPANILGSFLMGLFVSSDVLSNSLKHVLTVEAPMALLPVRSPLQEHMAFQVGLRTGLCGSLTTFASWLTQTVLMIVGASAAAAAARAGGAAPTTHSTHAAAVTVTVMHHSQWVEALGGLLVGTLAAMGALVLGQHCALLLYHKLNPGAFIPYGSPAPEQIKLEGLEQQEQREEEEWEEEEEEAVSAGARRLRTVSSTRQGSITVVVVEGEEGGGRQTHTSHQQQQQRSPRQGRSASSSPPWLHSLTSFSGRQHSSSARSRSTSSPRALQLSGEPGTALQQQQLEQLGAAAAVGSTAVQPSTAAVQTADSQLLQPRSASKQGVAAGSGDVAAAALNGGGAGVSGGSAAALADAAGAAKDSSAAAAAAGGGVFVDEVDEVEAPSVSAVQVLVDGFAVLSIAVLTGVSLWRIIQGNTSTSLATRDDAFAQEFFWWSILLGPVGCYGRYFLSRFNGRLPGRWIWFPAGTFAANIAACCIDYVMKVVPVLHPLDRTSAAVLAGVVGGVGGCLSTVSTWVVEVQRLLLSFPKTSHGYQYVGISLGTALALGLLAYGVPVWTAY